MHPMLVSIERKSRSSWPEVSHSLQHCQAAQLVESIKGINEHCPARLCILSQELYGSQSPQSPLTPFLFLTLFPHLHLQVFPQHLCRLLLLHPLCLQRQNFLIFRLIIILLLVIYLCLFLSHSLHHSINNPLSHGVCCTLYTVLKACSQLQSATHCLRLVLILSHNEFGQGLVERRLYFYGTDSWTYIKRHQATCH